MYELSVGKKYPDGELLPERFEMGVNGRQSKLQMGGTLAPNGWEQMLQLGGTLAPNGRVSSKGEDFSSKW